MKISTILLSLFSAGILLLSGGCSTVDMSKGSVALELGDYPLAISFFSRVLKRNPGHFGARLGMGKALLQQAMDREGDTTAWHDAIMHLQAARTIHSEPSIPLLLAQVWSERASELLKSNDTLGALEALTSAISVHPDSPEPINLAGIIYFRKGRPQKAREYFERALSLDSTNASPFFNLGMLYWEKKQVRQAHDFWKKACTLAPKDENILHWYSVSENELQMSMVPRDSTESGVK